jgi:hypothetical protein
MQLDGLDAAAALKRLADDAGLDPAEDPAKMAERAARHAAAQAKAARHAARDAEARLQGARMIWRQARGPVALLRDYLHARGVRVSALGGVPASLRLHPELNYWAPGQDRKREDPAFRGPAMVAAIGRGQLVGVHRTWIAPQGRARLVDGTRVPKKWIGRTGAIFGNPVKFCPTSPRMIVGEGIETTLAAWSAMVAAGRSDWSAEAGLSRGAIVAAADTPSGLEWAPPPGVSAVLILGEGSGKNPAEAERLTITATADSAGFLVSVAPALTIAFAPGRYTWRAMLTRPTDGARASVGLGSFKIEPDPATSTADTRSTARRTLAAIEARIEGRITKDAESYTIEGRSISRTPLEILEKLVGIYRAKVQREEGGSAILVNKVTFK